MKNIKKLQFTKASHAEIVNQEADITPLGNEDVRGSTLCSLISPGTELALYNNVSSRFDFPINSGYSAVFKIKEIGSHVKDLKVGQNVFCMGGHQQDQRIHMEKGTEYIFTIPPHL